VAKLEDKEGFALSNSSKVVDVTKPNDRLTALPEENTNPKSPQMPGASLHGGQNAIEHLEALKNF